MLVILWDKDSPWAVSDGGVSKYVDNEILDYRLWSTQGSHMSITGQESVVNEFRLRVLRGELNHEEVIFRVDGKDLVISSVGRLREWPVGFCDLLSNQLSELIGGQLDQFKKKEEHGNTGTNEAVV